MNTPTYCQCSRGNELVVDHLRRIEQAICDLVNPLALVIAGSYGRGEGVVKQETGNSYKPVNDYDVVIVVRRSPWFPVRRRLKRLRDTIARELDIWHVDLMIVEEDDLYADKVRMMYFDMKFGSQVFCGDEGVLERIPYDRSTAIPQSEIVNLLVNRMVTLLEGHSMLAAPADPEQKARQIGKVLYALVDGVLQEQHSYRTRYQEKREALMRLDSSSGGLAEFLAGHLDWMEKAWEYKLSPEETESESLLGLWERVRSQLCQEIIQRTALLSELGGSDLSAGDVLSCWRGKDDGDPLAERVIRLVLNLESKRTVEQRIFALLNSYPDSREWAHLDFSVPSYSVAGEQGVFWTACAEDLINAWYRAG